MSTVIKKYVGTFLSKKLRQSGEADHIYYVFINPRQEFRETTLLRKFSFKSGSIYTISIGYTEKQRPPLLYPIEVKGPGCHMLLKSGIGVVTVTAKGKHEDTSILRWFRSELNKQKEAEARKNKKAPTKKKGR
jgi:hypothetical protein